MLCSGDTGQNIIDPKILRGASRDTHEIFKMLKYLEPLYGHPEATILKNKTLCIHWWTHLL
jgi:hypothetical protein